MTLPAPYKYRKARKAQTAPSTNRVRPQSEEEFLTGEVQGLDASDWEERLARALSKYDVPFEFRTIEFAPIRNIPGAREIDFKIYLDYGVQPLMVDGEFAHKTASQISDDRNTDALLNAYLGRFGYLPIVRIPDGIKWHSDTLETQEGSDAFVEELIR